MHTNQYGFIKGRTIQDCLAWAYQFLLICHKSKRDIVILKLDFEKAFDKLEHQVILEALRNKGFSAKWVQWIQKILSSGTSLVLLNGVLRKPFQCRRGVRQGDPTLLFVLGADLLQSVIYDAASRNIISHPIGQEFGGDFPISSMPMSPLSFYQLMLPNLPGSTRLKVTFNKSF